MSKFQEFLQEFVEEMKKDSSLVDGLKEVLGESKESEEKQAIRLLKELKNYGDDGYQANVISALTSVIGESTFIKLPHSKKQDMLNHFCNLWHAGHMLGILGHAANEVCRSSEFEFNGIFHMIHSYIDNDKSLWGINPSTLEVQEFTPENLVSLEAWTIYITPLFPTKALAKGSLTMINDLCKILESKIDQF